MPEEKLLPSSIESEEAVIGSLLIDRGACVLIEGKLSADDFYREANGTIFRAITQLTSKHTPADFVTLCEYLEREGTLDDVGGRVYLTSLLNAVPTAMHVEYYAGIVRRCATMRRMIHVATEIAGLGYSGEDTERALAEAEAAWQGVRQHARVEQEIIANTEAIVDFITRQDEIEKLYAHGQYLCDTPWRDINNMIYGFQPGNLVIVAACSGHGKSICLENIAEHNARHGKKVLYFHLELTTEQMMARQVCRYSMGVTINDIVRGAADREKLASVGELVMGWPGFIRYVHCPGWSAERIAATIRRETALGKCDLAIVDYLNKIALPSERGRTDEMALGLAVETLKIVAEVAATPVILASQVNREHVGRTKGPKLTCDDIRGSGQPAEKSNLVLMLWNESVSDPECQHSLIDVYVSKNTLGRTGECQLVWDKPAFRFTDLPRREL
jgi:replicative DNA helicase